MRLEAVASARFLSMVSLTNRVGCLWSLLVNLLQNLKVQLALKRRSIKEILGIRIHLPLIFSQNWILLLQHFFEASNRWIDFRFSCFLFSTYSLPWIEAMLSNEIDAYHQTYIRQLPYARSIFGCFHKIEVIARIIDLRGINIQNTLGRVPDLL